MDIEVDQFLQWLSDFLWPFLRIGALFAAAPVFSARTVPVRARIILALMLTFILLPSIQPAPEVTIFSATGLLMVLQQLAVGVVMGFLVQIMFATLLVAGQITATTMGLGFASTVDPQNGVQVTMLSQFYVIIATLIFLAIDGHLLLIQILAQTFVLIPVDAILLTPALFQNAVEFAGQMFMSAMLIALPAVTGVLLVNLGFGGITKAAPQLNIFSIGFPITILAGFILILLSLGALQPMLNQVFLSGFANMQNLLF